MHIQTKMAYSVLLALLTSGLVCGVLLAAGCNKKGPVQVESIRAREERLNPPKPVQTPVREQLPPAQAADGEEAVEAEYAGPKVIVEDFTVKLPYPEFDGEGRYDIKCSVQAEEPVPSSTVWKILAIGVDGTEVGSTQKHLVLYDSYFKPLDLNSFYCKSLPVALEFQATSKTASKAGGSGEVESSGNNGPGRGGNAGVPSL